MVLSALHSKSITQISMGGACATSRNSKQIFDYLPSLMAKMQVFRLLNANQRLCQPARRTLCTHFQFKISIPRMQSSLRDAIAHAQRAKAADSEWERERESVGESRREGVCVELCVWQLLTQDSTSKHLSKHTNPSSSQRQCQTQSQTNRQIYIYSEIQLRLTHY